MKSDKEAVLQSHVDHNATQHTMFLPCLGRVDVRELNELLRTERRRLYRAALKLLGNAEDAEDAVQEGLLAALRNLHQFEGRARLSTWLTRIVLNACLMRLRSLRAHESEPIEKLIGRQGRLRLPDVLVDGQPSPEEVYAQAEQRQILNQGLQGLSWPHRRALALCHFQGMTTKEAASALGLSEGTVKSQVHRARRKLSEQVRRIRQARALAT
jgi:RNA polymerase sigma-70 factor (ECF subfamily)